MGCAEGWLHLKLGGPSDWVRVFVSLDDCVLSVVADAQASLLPPGSCVSFDLATPGSHVVGASSSCLSGDARHPWICVFSECTWVLGWCFRAPVQSRERC
jgi:hypothetical protein